MLRVPFASPKFLSRWFRTDWYIYIYTYIYIYIHVCVCVCRVCAGLLQDRYNCKSICACLATGHEQRYDERSDSGGCKQVRTNSAQTLSRSSTTPVPEPRDYHQHRFLGEIETMANATAIHFACSSPGHLRLQGKAQLWKPVSVRHFCYAQDACALVMVQRWAWRLPRLAPFLM